MTEKEKKVPSNVEESNKSKVIKVWLIFAAIRLAFVFLARRSYIHPDEFFQSLEIVSTDIFESESYRTWEFNRTNPIRSISIPYLVYSIPFQLLKHLSTSGLINLNSFDLVVFPRIFITILTFLIDFFIFKIVKLVNKSLLESVIVFFSTSYVSIIMLTHTFSNSLETIFFSGFLYYTLSNILALKRNDFKESELNSFRLSLFFSLGFFNRPTFAIFAFIPLVYLAIGLLRKFQIRHALKLSFFTVVISVILIIADTIYYTEVSLSEFVTSFIENDYERFLKPENWIITPLSFFKYNSNNENLATHGQHSILQHIIANCFQLFFLAHFLIILKFIIFIFKGIKNLFKKSETATCQLFNFELFFYLTYLVPLSIFSLITHKETRFLLPLIIPFVFLNADLLHNDFFQNKNNTDKKDSLKNKLIFMQWIVFNVFFSLIFGFMHQGGLIPSIDFVQNVIKHASNQRIEKHIMFYHTYMPPRYLINVPVHVERLKRNSGKLNEEKSVFIYDMMSSDSFEVIDNKIGSIVSNKDSKKDMAMFLITPAVVVPELCQSNKSFVLIQKFFFHAQFERFPMHIKMISESESLFQKCQTLSEYMSQLSILEKVLNSFSLNLYQVL